MMCSTASVQVNVEAGVRRQVGRRATAAARHPSPVGPAAPPRPRVGRRLCELAVPGRAADRLEEHPARGVAGAGSRANRSAARPAWRVCRGRLRPLGAGRAVDAHPPTGRTMDRAARAHLPAVDPARKRGRPRPAGLPPPTTSTTTSRHCSRRSGHGVTSRSDISTRSRMTGGRCRRPSSPRCWTTRPQLIGLLTPASRSPGDGGTRPGSGWTIRSSPERPLLLSRSPSPRCVSIRQHAVAGEVDGYCERWTARGRCPADDVAPNSNKIERRTGAHRDRSTETAAQETAAQGEDQR